MKTIRQFVQHKKTLLIISSPLAGVVTLSLFPLNPFAREALVGVVLIWMQMAFLFGFMK
jgi:hypothetical protein